MLVRLLDTFGTRTAPTPSVVASREAWQRPTTAGAAAPGRSAHADVVEQLRTLGCVELGLVEPGAAVTEPAAGLVTSPRGRARAVAREARWEAALGTVPGRLLEGVAVARPGGVQPYAVLRTRDNDAYVTVESRDGLPVVRLRSVTVKGGLVETVARPLRRLDPAAAQRSNRMALSRAAGDRTVTVLDLGLGPSVPIVRHRERLALASSALGGARNHADLAAFPVLLAATAEHARRCERRRLRALWAARRLPWVLGPGVGAAVALGLPTSPVLAAVCGALAGMALLLFGVSVQVPLGLLGWRAVPTALMPSFAPCAKAAAKQALKAERAAAGVAGTAPAAPAARAARVAPVVEVATPAAEPVAVPDPVATIDLLVDRVRTALLEQPETEPETDEPPAYVGKRVRPVPVDAQPLTAATAEPAPEAEAEADTVPEAAPEPTPVADPVVPQPYVGKRRANVPVDAPHAEEPVPATVT